MNILRRKPIRILLVLVGLILVTVAAVQIFLPTEKIKDLALQQAREKLGREVSAGDVAVKPGPRRVELVAHRIPGVAAPVTGEIPPKGRDHGGGGQGRHRSP